MHPDQSPEACYRLREEILQAVKEERNRLLEERNEALRRIHLAGDILFTGSCDL